MAPPLPSPVPVAGPTAWLLVNAQSVTVSEDPSLLMAPPAEPSVMAPVMVALKLPPEARLFVKVDDVTVRLPSFSIPPPLPKLPMESALALLLVMTTWSRLSVAPASMRTPPPLVPTSCPLAIVRPEMATFAPAISKTRLASLPLTDSLFAPGPLIVTLSVIDNSPLVSVMVPCSPLAKSIVSPLWARPISARSEPVPWSCRFVTVKALGTLRSSSASRRSVCSRRFRWRSGAVGFLVTNPQRSRFNKETNMRSPSGNVPVE